MSVLWLQLILIACLLANAYVFFSLSRQYRMLFNLNEALIRLALNSMALRHCWRTQIYTLMAVVDKEMVGRDINPQ